MHGVDDGEWCRIFFERGLGGVSGELAERLQVWFAHFQITSPRQWLTRLDRGRRRLGHARCGTEEIGLDHLIEERRLGEQTDGERFAREHDVDRTLDSDESRQALRATGPRQQAELDLGQADLCTRERHTMMTAQGQLEPPAERHTLDRRHDRLRHPL